MSWISCLGGNFVSEQVQWDMKEGWGQGDQTTQDHFKPIETFEERFDALIGKVRRLGYSSMDLWSAQIHFRWCTDRHLEAAQRVLKRHEVRIPSYATWFGTTDEEIQRACEIMKALNIEILSGGSESDDRARVIKYLRRYQLKFAVENHPEKTVEELFKRTGEGDEDVVGLAIDTGWFGTYGVDAMPLIEGVYSRIFHLHLKDVRARRTGEKTGYQLIDLGHETCALGDGIVRVKEIAQYLKKRGFSGPISVEHEPEHYNPEEELIVSLKRLNEWMS